MGGKGQADKKVSQAEQPLTRLFLRSENTLQRMGGIISTLCHRIDAKAVCLADRYYSTE